MEVNREYMMEANERLPFAYVVGVDGGTVTLNLRDTHRGRLAVVPGGVSPVLQVGARFGIRHGTEILVGEVVKVHFTESREAHREGIGTTVSGDEPLRQILARILGRLTRPPSLGCMMESQGTNMENTQPVIFVRGGLTSPTLGAEAFPLRPEEQEALASYRGEGSLEVGRTLDPPMPIRVNIDDLLSRHVIVTGSTGQGKSCLTAAILQRLLRNWPRLRCILFDVNGEYRRAFSTLPNDNPEDESRWSPVTGVRVTQFGPLGGGPSGVQRYQIPYYALGRNGLEAMLLPSERAQRPALRFAISALPYVEWRDDGAALPENEVSMFDDCRSGGEEDAAKAIHLLRERILNGTDRAEKWPPLKVLAPLVAEFVALQPDTRAGGHRRDSFHYGHVSSLIRRIHGIAEDVALTKVINVAGEATIPDEGDPITAAAREILERIFGLGGNGGPVDWRIHIVDLRLVPYDLLPFLLGAILYTLLDELFRRGPGGTPPMLLVLEEAHHYLRRLYAAEDDPSLRELLAYERLAKEGRKFGVSLWLSTQRPSELSPTVLAQCGTWFCLRLTAQSDLDRVRHASEWADPTTVSRIAALPRQEAIAFGSAFPVPVHIRLPDANPVPQSRDPEFHGAWMMASQSEESMP